MFPHEHYSVIFLLDGQPATKVLLLKRAEWKSFAPNQWTGIGGKYEAGETIESGALRELREEIGIEVPIQQFARLSINNDTQVIHYFWGIMSPTQSLSCTEGTLHWIETSSILERTIVSATKPLLHEWLRHNLSTNVMIRLNICRSDKTDNNPQVESIEVEELELTS